MQRVSLLVIQYGTAVLTVGALIAFKIILDPLIGDGNAFLLLLAGIMFTSWVGGMGPGLLATALAALFGDYFFLNPRGVLLQNTPEVNVQLGLFIVEGTLISWGTAALRRALVALQEADRHKDHFLGTLAHEFRNHLAPISYSLKVMRMIHEKSGATQVEQARERMERQVEQLRRFTDDLMDLTRIRAGKMQLRMERTELAAIVNEAIESSRPLIEASGHELTVSLMLERLYLHADPARLVQAFTNLLNNAAKYTPARGQIGLHVERVRDQVHLRVRDTGMGIPAELLPRVFDLYVQVDRTLGRAQGGLGIGLSLVRQIITLHGGTVEAFSAGPGQGSEFLIRLPLPCDGNTSSLKGAEYQAEQAG
jgi:signal transduction histidine kinase